MKNMTVKLSEIERGETFEIGNIEFIKFSEENGETIAIAKDIVFHSLFGENNRFDESDILKELKEKFLPGIAQEIGEENILEFETDLTTLDGVKTFGVMRSKISLPTLDFYRKYVDIFDRYKLDDWYWLATPWSAKPHYESSCILCVSPSGRIYDFYDYVNGVRPFLRFVSSISVSRVN